MSRLIKIASYAGEPRANVIFVHGLGGHAYDTWRRGADDKTFWPLWLADDVPGISVYTVAYEAPPTNWLGTSMPLQDRAVNVLEYLLSEPGLKTGPIVFVCHSLGGLIVKQIMLDLQRQKDLRPECGDFFDRVREVIFAATPHTGSRQGSLLQRLSFLAWPSTIASVLVANDPTLRSINVAYRGLAQERKETMRHKIFYETQDTSAGRIVDEGSSDPGLPGDPPVPIDADHIKIVKPADRSTQLYVITREFVAAIPAVSDSPGALEILPRPEVLSEQSHNIVPKLIRLAAVGVVALVGYKGVQALIAPPPDVEHIQKPLVEQLAIKDAQIAALTQALLAGNPKGAAAPGAQEAVSGALRSVAQGAEEGDKRLQQALDLLSNNKIAEATQILNAVAEEKMARAQQASAQAEKNRKLAATAFRNLGAIAGLKEPGKALVAYKKAVELDPEDMDSAFWVGWIEISHGDHKEAEKQLRRVLSWAKTTKNDYYEVWSLLSLGDAQVAQGDLNAALLSFSDSRDIFERLAKSDPQNAEWQRDLSVSYEKIGDVQVAQGDLKAALQSFSDSRDIFERLAKSDPQNAGWQRDLSVSYNKIGDAQVAQGDLKAALQSFSDSRDIFERLAKSDPQNAGWRRDLSVSYNKIGDVQVAQGDLKAALQSFSDSRDIAERLAKSDPQNAGWQRDLSVSFARLASVYEKSGDKTKAHDALTAGRAIILSLLKDHPDWVEWKKDLVWFDGQLASLDKVGMAAERENKPINRKKRR